MGLKREAGWSRDCQVRLDAGQRAMLEEKSGALREAIEQVQAELKEGDDLSWWRRPLVEETPENAARWRAIEERISSLFAAFVNAFTMARTNPYRHFTMDPAGTVHSQWSGVWVQTMVALQDPYEAEAGEPTEAFDLIVEMAWNSYLKRYDLDIFLRTAWNATEQLPETTDALALLLSSPWVAWDDDGHWNLPPGKALFPPEVALAPHVTFVAALRGSL